MTFEERIEVLKRRFPNPASYEPACPLCDDTTWVRRYVPYLEPRVEACVCEKARLAAQRLASAGIPPEYRRSTFEAFRAYNDTLIDALWIARDFAARYPVQQSQRTDPSGLLLIGPAGVGKTHLAAALLTQIIARTGIHGLFYKTRDLLRLMRHSYNPAIQTTEQQILDPILTCDLLVLDDLGAERMTDWVADTMDLIVDTRYSAGLPIVATTNFPDLPDPDELNGLFCRVGFRMHSRLQRLCRFVTVKGADYRAVRPDTSDAALQALAQERRPVLPAREFWRGSKFAPQDGRADLKWPGGRGGNT
jgi:DNA replication protein DnaC